MNEEHSHKSCAFHEHMEKEQELLFSLLGKRVPSWVFTMVVGAAVTIFGILTAINFNVVGGVGKQMEKSNKTMSQVQMSMIKVEAKMDQVGTRFDNFEKYNDYRMKAITEELKELHNFHQPGD